jgi:hypothetical protein
VDRDIPRNRQTSMTLVVLKSVALDEVPRSLMINTVPSSTISLTLGGLSVCSLPSTAFLEFSKVARTRLRERLERLAMRLQRAYCVSSSRTVTLGSERRTRLVRGFKANVIVDGASSVAERRVGELDAELDMSREKGSGGDDLRAAIQTPPPPSTPGTNVKFLAIRI